MSHQQAIEQLTIDRSGGSEKNYSSIQKMKASIALVLLVTVFCSGFVIQAAYLPENASPRQASVSVEPVDELAETKQFNSQENSSTEAAQLDSVLDASGHIVARRIATVSSRVTGKLNRLNIEEGQQVYSEQILAELDDKQAQISYQLAQADLTAKQAIFDELQLVYQHELKRLERRSSLYKKALISEQLLDDTRFTTEKTSAQLANKLALIELSKQKVALAQYQLEQHKIRAPFDGVVISKNAQVGELISSGSAGGGFIRTGVGTIVDMSSLEIEVEVAESYINRVQAKQKTVATLDAYPDWKIPSEVIAVIPTADRQKASIKVRVKLLTTDIKILPDMGVKVSFLATNSITNKTAI